MCSLSGVCDIMTICFMVNNQIVFFLIQIMGFSSESVAAFIAVLGILSIVAQVSYCSVCH